MQYRVIGDKWTILGFSLAGVDGYCVSTKEEALVAWKKAKSTRECGVVILTDDVAKMLLNEIEVHIKNLDFPLVVSISNFDGTGEKVNLKKKALEAVGGSVG